VAIDPNKFCLSGTELIVEFKVHGYRKKQTNKRDLVLSISLVESLMRTCVSSE